ncbi:hypothetical protein J3R83DRAFT_2682 [Lanmaoa asiatica]|nr:hypothetical protein J3R83DRAFT_2682 [Lanmaoa asiatica]
MPFGLTIGTERANSLQNAIQDELMKRGFSPDAGQFTGTISMHSNAYPGGYTDPVMAEYITIMIINNKTAVFQFSTDPSFTDWLFVEAAKGAPESEIPLTSPSTSPSLTSPATSKPQATSEIPVHSPLPSATDHRRPLNPRAGPPSGVPLYQQALSSTLGHGQKRTASVRSPSPTGHGPSKTRRMDVPTGPRAMQSGGSRGEAGTGASGRSLLDRVGGRNNAHPSYARGDEIQARIDAVTNGGIPPGGATPDPGMMMGFQNGVGMDMTAANVNANTMMLQEMMMNQMTLMAQMATSMGMLNPATGQMMGGGFPGMQQGDMGMYPGGGTFGQGQAPAQSVNGRGRGGGRGGRGRGGGPGRGGHIGASPAPTSESPSPIPTQTQAQPQAPSEINAAQSVEPSVPILAPSPILASTQQPLPAQQQRIPYALPERPQSPTLCKFGTKCTNSQCRIFASLASRHGRERHGTERRTSKATVNTSPSPLLHQLTPAHLPIPSHAASVPLVLRPNCTYSHPRPTNTHFNQQCRFGAACTRAACPFQHPEGRVLPTSFHRGLSTNGPLVSVPTPETGSMSGSVHRSMTFNVPNKGAGTTDNVKEKLEKRIKELEATKKAVQDAEVAAGKTNETKPAVPITA